MNPIPIVNSIDRSNDMESYSYECRRRELIIPPPKSTMKSLPCTSTWPQFEIIFILSGSKKYRQWILSPNSTELQPAGEVGLPSATKSIQFNLRISTRQKERMFDVLNQGLEGYDLSIAHREGLAKYAVETAWDIIVYSMSPSKNQLNLYIDFTVLHKHVLYENHAIQESDDGPTMSPTSEASIESLETKIIDDSFNASCPVCLEVFQVGVCMPCSHMFHGDCIKTWLRISHYCPVCRFQMPTAD